MQVLESHTPAQPWAVVTNADNLIALSVTRSLGRHGVPVAALFNRTERFRPYAQLMRASRYLSAAHDLREGPYDEALVEALVRVAGRVTERPVLFPVSDRDMLVVSRCRAELEPHYRLLLPPHDTLDMLLSKERFARFAADHDLPIPRTFGIESPADAERCVDEMRFPCVIKPSWRDREWLAVYGNTKVLRAESPQELRERLREASSCSSRLVVQECLVGPETEISCSFTFLDETSRPLGIATCRKIRQYPVGFGNTAMAEATVDDEIAELTRSICAKIGAVGYVGVEFKRDPSDGRHKILEVTAGRLNRQSEIADAGGLNVALLWYSHLTGRDPGPRAPQRPGVRWVSEIGDLRALPSYLRDGSWSLASWLKSYRGVRRCEILARDDLRAVAGLLLAAAGHAVRRGGARLLGSGSAGH
jgi:predicted ATP-grasp superfamily ATP-dependent carboligase